MPQRESRVPWPQMRIVGVVMGMGDGRLEAREGLRVRAAFCAEERGAWEGWRVWALR